MINDWRGCLRGFGWAHALSEDDLRAIPLHGGRCIHVEPGTIIFSPSLSPDSVFFVREGLVRIFRVSKDGSELTLGYVKPNEVCGELSVFSGLPRESYAIAILPCQVCEMPQATFERMMRRQADVLTDVTSSISRRLKRIEARLSSKTFHDTFTQTCSMLYELSEDFGRPDALGTLIDLPLTQAELASLVGTTRQTMNGHLKRLEESGELVRRDRRWVVLKPEQLLPPFA